MYAPVAAGIRSDLEQNITDAILISMNNITNSTKDNNRDGKNIDTNKQENGQSYQVPISPEVINHLLIGKKLKKAVFIIRTNSYLIVLISIIFQD